MSYQRFKVETDGDISEIRLVDTELSDLMIQTQLQEELASFVQTQKPVKLVIDFTPVRYCTSAAINAMLQTRTRMNQVQGRLALCGMSKHVRDSFRILNLDGTLFKIFGTMAEAKASLGT